MRSRVSSHPGSFFGQPDPMAETRASHKRDATAVSHVKILDLSDTAPAADTEKKKKFTPLGLVFWLTLLAWMAAAARTGRISGVANCVAWFVASFIFSGIYFFFFFFNFNTLEIAMSIELRNAAIAAFVWIAVFYAVFSSSAF